MLYARRNDTGATVHGAVDGDPVEVSADQYGRLLTASASAGIASSPTYTAFTLTMDTSIYASGDVLADTQLLSNAFTLVNGLGTLNSIVLNDKDDQGIALDLLFFSANVSLGTENLVPSITDADGDNFLGLISVFASDWVDVGGCRLVTLPANRCGITLKAATGTKDIYIAAITRGGTPTYSANGITGRIGIV